MSGGVGVSIARHAPLDGKGSVTARPSTAAVPAFAYAEVSELSATEDSVYRKKKQKGVME